MSFSIEQLRNCKVVQNDPANQKAIADAAQRQPFHPALGGFSPAERQPNPVPALDQKPSVRAGGKRKVAVIVTIIRCGHKELDGDNLQASYKALRDAISTSFGVNDADHRITWQYRQSPGRGAHGTIVKIDCR